jgi:hypothetical protein
VLIVDVGGALRLKELGAGLELKGPETLCSGRMPPTLTRNCGKFEMAYVITFGGFQRLRLFRSLGFHETLF